MAVAPDAPGWREGTVCPGCLALSLLGRRRLAPQLWPLAILAAIGLVVLLMQAASR